MQQGLNYEEFEEENNFDGEELISFHHLLANEKSWTEKLIISADFSLVAKILKKQCKVLQLNKLTTI